MKIATSLNHVIKWLLSVRVFSNFLINSYSICLAIDKCEIIHWVLHKIAYLLIVAKMPVDDKKLLV